MFSSMKYGITGNKSGYSINANYRIPYLENKSRIYVKHQKPPLNFWEGKTKKIKKRFRKIDSENEDNLSEINQIFNTCGLRVYKPEVRYQADIVNVYKFIFKEAAEVMKQRLQTCHLAMEYFTQAMMRWPNLKRNEIGVITAASLMVASKFDELDYNLLPASYIFLQMKESPNIGHYDKSFTENDIIDCEKKICECLNWNLHQYTPYHFLENYLGKNRFYFNKFILELRN